MRRSWLLPFSGRRRLAVLCKRSLMSPRAAGSRRQGRCGQGCVGHPVQAGSTSKLVGLDGRCLGPRLGRTGLAYRPTGPASGVDSLRNPGVPLRNESGPRYSGRLRSGGVFWFLGTRCQSARGRCCPVTAPGGGTSCGVRRAGSRAVRRQALAAARTTEDALALLDRRPAWRDVIVVPGQNSPADLKYNQRPVQGSTSRGLSNNF